MYVKLFSKLLDSSVWLEPLPTRVVWVTLLASIDEDGFAAYAAPGNVARRAGVSLAEAATALAALEAPDPNSSDPDHEGRRIERVPGGWIVLNAQKYRALATRDDSRKATRERVARHRARKIAAISPADGNADVTACNDPVTPSEAYTDARTETKTKALKAKSPAQRQGVPLLLVPKKTKTLPAPAARFSKKKLESELRAAAEDVAEACGTDDPWALRQITAQMRLELRLRSSPPAVVRGAMIAAWQAHLHTAGPSMSALAYRVQRYFGGGLWRYAAAAGDEHDAVA